MLYRIEMSFGKNLARARKAARLTQNDLGDAVGVSAQAVSQWERDETKPELDKLPEIAKAVKASEGWLITGRGRSGPTDMSADDGTESPDDLAPMVRVVGYVGAAAVAHFYAVAQGDLDEVPPPEGATAETVAVEIRGNSLGALFDHWLVFYDDVRSPVTEDLYGKLCVVGLSDDRVLIKKLRKGRKTGLFRLISATQEDDINDVPVEWAARVKNMVPR